MLNAIQGVTISPEDIAEIEVATHWKGRKLDLAQPSTSLAAKFSIQHIAAATLLKGHAGAEAFDSESLTSPQMIGLRNLVRITPWPQDLPWPNDRPSGVKITFKDGSLACGECLSAPGGPDQPFSDAVIRSKILTNLKAWPNAAATVDRILALEEECLTQAWRDTLKLMIA